MFTGLIQDLGTVTNINDVPRGRRLTIKTGIDLSLLKTGASIACNGCCLTAIELGNGCFDVDVGAETMDVTTLGAWQVGQKINLETSLRAGDEMGGHIVSGHVDALGEVARLEEDGESWRLGISLPQNLMKYVASKGSVAIDGVSMTVNDVKGLSFEVCIIPHTWTHTNFQILQAGDKVNIEIDMLARYVARILGQDG